MRNMKLVDTVIALHEMARVVEEEVGVGPLSQDIRNCADRLHEISVAERQHSIETQLIINKAKK